MKLARMLVPSTLLVALIWAMGFAPSPSKAARNFTVDKQDILAEQALRKEFLDLEYRLGQGLPISDEEKARFDQLEPIFGRSAEPQRNPLDWQGGPDSFGYHYVDNQNGDSATYEWIELRGDPEATWTSWTGSHDDNTQVLQLGLTFPFYGQNYTQATVSTNGNLQFSTTSTLYTNVCLPTTNINGPVIFLYWDDLHLDYGGMGNAGNNVIGYRNFGDYTVIEYDSIGHCCSAGTSLKFQVILWADGRIKMQYNNLVFGSNANTQTIGIQAAGAGPALEYVCNATAGHQPVNNLAIWYTLADAGSISGHVQDEDGAAIPNVRVDVSPVNLYAMTDGSGNYSLPTVVTGTYDLTASKRGYANETAEDVVVNLNQNTVVDFTLESSGLLTFSANNLPQPINDVTVNNYTMDVTTAVPIDDIDVLIDLTHTWDSDLEISLTSPGGTTVLLAQNRGGSADNYTGTIFNDEATTPIGAGTAPFTGEFQPETPLSDLDDEGTQGTWTLTIDDQAGGDTGNLLIWELYVTPGNSNGGHISGTVSDHDNGNPIPNARVELVGEATVRFTNAQGQFVFSFLDPGTYSIDVSAAFYEDRTETGIVVTSGETTDRDVELNSNAIIYPYTGAPVPIFDLDTSFATISISEDFTIEGIYVLIGNLTHTFDADLDIWIENPDGMRVLLSDQNGGGGENYIETLFDDNATTPIGDGTPPFTGTFIPDEALEPLLGFSAEGDWTLVVYDNFGADEGEIVAWSVIFQGQLGPEGVLTGVVRDLASNQPISAAVVSIPEADVETTTDAQGQYEMDVPAGTWNVRYQANVHCDSVINGIVINDEGTVTQHVVLRAPIADISVTSLSVVVASGGVTTEEFDIENTGNCPLSFALSDTSAWLSELPGQGTIPPGQSATITVTFDAGALPAGEYQSRITVTHSGAGSPVQIPVTMDVGTSAGDIAAQLPTVFALHANYPNPFNSSTEIRFDLPAASAITLSVYNVVGQHVLTLVDGVRDAGSHAVSWHGIDKRGADVGTGIYIVRMEASGYVFASKAVLMR